MIELLVLIGNGLEAERQKWYINANKVDYITPAPNGGCVIHVGKTRICSLLSAEEATVKVAVALERE